MEEAVKHFRQKELTSRYSTDYGFIVKKMNLKPQPNILMLKNVSNLRFKEFLTTEAQDYIDNWSALNDFYICQERVLDTLRSFNARYLAVQIPTSEYK